MAYVKCTFSIFPFLLPLLTYLTPQTPTEASLITVMKGSFPQVEGLFLVNLALNAQKLNSSEFPVKDKLAFCQCL